MRAIALIEEPDHVCYRYRLEAYLPELFRRGSTLEAVAISRRTLSRLGQFRAAATADAVILQRKLLPLWQLALLRRSARRLIYDFDDAVFHRDSYAAKGIASRSRMARFWATVYAADCIVAGNEFLAEQARQFVEPDRITVVPTSIRPEAYPLAQHAHRARSTRLVWIGQPSTLAGLELAQAQLTATARRVADIELRVVCSTFPKLGPMRVVPRQWTQQTEGTELARCDIGVSWLPDDPWSQGKCGLKVLQYLAAGLPVVANSVGMHCELVQPGVTGFLADTPQQWADAIARLAADPALRQRMGDAGRELVERRFSVRQSAKRLAGLLESVTGFSSGVDRDLPSRALQPTLRPRTDRAAASADRAPARGEACEKGGVW